MFVGVNMLDIHGYPRDITKTNDIFPEWEILISYKISVSKFHKTSLDHQLNKIIYMLLTYFHHQMVIVIKLCQHTLCNFVGSNVSILSELFISDSPTSLLVQRRDGHC